MTTFKLNENSKVTVDSQNNFTYRDNTGALHRTDGPAVINIDGSREYHLHGLLHRLDGPAVIDARGFQFWLFGKQVTEDEFFKQSFNLIYRTQAH